MVGNGSGSGYQEFSGIFAFILNFKLQFLQFNNNNVSPRQKCMHRACWNCGNCRLIWATRKCLLPVCPYYTHTHSPYSSSNCMQFRDARHECNVHKKFVEQTQGMCESSGRTVVPNAEKCFSVFVFFFCFSIMWVKHSHARLLWMDPSESAFCRFMVWLVLGVCAHATDDNRLSVKYYSWKQKSRRKKKSNADNIGLRRAIELNFFFGR